MMFMKQQSAFRDMTQEIMICFLLETNQNFTVYVYGNYLEQLTKFGNMIFLLRPMSIQVDPFLNFVEFRKSAISFG